MKKVFLLLTLIIITLCCSYGENYIQNSAESKDITEIKKDNISTLSEESLSENNKDDTQEVRNLIMEALISQKEINADDLHINKLILGIFLEGKQILAKEGDFYYWYEMDGESYVESDKIAKNCNGKDFLVLTTDDESNKRTVHLPDSKIIQFPRLINVVGNRAIIQTSEDQKKHYNFDAELLSGSAIEITHIDKLNSDERKLNRWETLIALPNDTTLCHYFMWRDNSDNSYSLWLIVDKNSNEINQFTTEYFDDLDNICVSENGEYVCFTYGQTTSHPSILNIQEESVYSIFNESDFYGFEAVTFMNWVNEETLAIGYRKNGEQIVKFQKVLFE
jgi:hypothetical protein